MHLIPLVYFYCDIFIYNFPADNPAFAG